MPEEKSLPKPSPDLPLPEKELPEGKISTPEPMPVVKNEKPAGKSHLLKYSILGFLLVAIIAVIGGGAYFLGMNKSDSQVAETPTPTPDEQAAVACTMEAKLCPDGVTSVGRQGPKCEFAPCPTGTASSVNTSDWKKYSNPDLGISFKYPSDWEIESNKSNDVTLSKTANIPCDGGKNCNQTSTITISVSKLIPNTSLNNFFSSKYLTFGQELNATLMKESKKSTIDGSNAISIPLPGAADYNGHITVVVNNDSGYGLKLDGLGDKDSDNQAYDGLISTFKFTSLMDGSVGESCGPNAGAAGNAKCDSGLTCININSSGVGTCAK